MTDRSRSISSLWAVILSIAIHAESFSLFAVLYFRTCSITWRKSLITDSVTSNGIVQSDVPDDVYASECMLFSQTL